MPDALVSGAGTAAANGVYVETGTENGKAKFVLDVNWDIRWSGIRWEIREIGSVAYNATAFTGTTYPWEATGWAAVFGDTPVPTVTENVAGGANPKGPLSNPLMGPLGGPIG